VGGGSGARGDKGMSKLAGGKAVGDRDNWGRNLKKRKIKSVRKESEWGSRKCPESL